jgi:hypothetical protein
MIGPRIGEWDGEGPEAVAESLAQAMRREIERQIQEEAARTAVTMRKTLTPGAARMEDREDWPEKVAQAKRVDGWMKRGTKQKKACQLEGLDPKTYRRIKARMKLEEGDIPTALKKGGH